MNRKPVYSSHLALRFYKHDGWTRQILEPYLIQGRVCDQWVEQEVRDYYFLDHTQGSRLDMQKLYSEQISEVIRWYAGLPRESDIEFLNSMNW